MGRQLRRVPIDFDWPLNKPWGGFINPFYYQKAECPKCDGHGYSESARHLRDQWYGLVPFRPEDRGSTPWKPTDPAVLDAAERRTGSSLAKLCASLNRRWCHHLNSDDVKALVERGRLWELTSGKPVGYIPTPQEVNEWSLSLHGIGHDCINQHICLKAECDRLGFPLDCPRCSGTGELWPCNEIKKLYEDWVETDPPAGDAYQLWETISDGSPITPAFRTPEELADYIVSNPDYSWRRNDMGKSREYWLDLIKGEGWCPSLEIIAND